MQVSWIDADHLQSLLAQIAPPETCANKEPPSQSEIAVSAGFMDEVALEPCAVIEPKEVPQAAFFDATVPVEQSSDDDAQEDEQEYHGKPLHNSAAALPLGRIRDKLRAIRQRATEAGILARVSDTAPQPEPEAEVKLPVVESSPVETTAIPDSITLLPQTPAFDVPQGSRDERLAAFAGWARKVLHKDGGHVMVMSDDGEVLWGGEAKAGLVLSTMMAWGAATRSSAMSAYGTQPVVRQPLASGNVLTVIPVETSAGSFHAAVTAPAAISEEIAMQLRGALCAAMA